MTRPSRRSVLAALSACTATLAGCTGGSTDGTTSQTTRRPTVAPTAQPTATGTDRGTETTTATDETLPTSGPPLAGVEAFDEHVPEFMQAWDVPGGTVAVAQGEDLVFTRGYGYANRETEAVVQPDALCRVGSISKSITAVAVLDLIERDALSLDDRAIDLIPDLVPDGGPSDERASDITVRHLLTHSAGWTVEGIGYDPVFEMQRVAETEGETSPASAEAIVTHVLRRDLRFDPGSAYSYLNVGYTILGRIVEAVTGESYEQAVTDRVLDPVGIDRMQIGPTRRENQLDGEMRYYDGRTVQSVFPDDGQVPAPYGKFSMAALDAPGGWVGSTVDLCRFCRGFDGRSGVPDVLDEPTQAMMTARPSIERWQGADQYYGKGWYVVPESSGPPSLWHNGSIPGSYGFMYRDAPNDLTVAALFNTRSNRDYDTFNREAQVAIVKSLVETDSWPDRNLYDRYD